MVSKCLSLCAKQSCGKKRSRTFQYQDVIHRRTTCASRADNRVQTGPCCHSNPKRIASRSSPSAQRAEGVQNTPPDAFCMQLVRFQTAGTAVCKPCTRFLSAPLTPFSLTWEAKETQALLSFAEDTRLCRGLVGSVRRRWVPRRLIRVSAV